MTGRRGIVNAASVMELNTPQTDVTYHAVIAVSHHNSPMRACGGRFTVRQCDFGTFAAPEGACHVCLMLLVCRLPHVCCEL